MLNFPLLSRVSQRPCSIDIGGYILCGTSRGYIYLGIVILRTREGTSLVDQFKWRVHPLGFFKENKGGDIPCGSLACKGFYKVERNLKNRRLFGDWM